MPASTSLVTLHRNIPVHVSPNGRVVGAVSATQPLVGQQTVMPIISIRDGWYHVRLPGRPDGSTGWISTIGTTLSTTFWRVYIDRLQRKAHIYLRGKLKRTYSVIVGNPSTPTPSGTFFVTEIMEERGEVTGPYALATSAFSNVLTEFDGGSGQVALHGREGLPEPLGSASSHGCVRFSSEAITWLVEHVAVGSPIIIT